MNMTPEEFDIDFDFDKEYGYAHSDKTTSEADDFDLDAALARELGPDFDAQFEKEFAEAQAALNADLPHSAKPSREERMDQTRLFSSFTALSDSDEEDRDESAEDDDWEADADEDAELSDLFNRPTRVPENMDEIEDDWDEWDQRRQRRQKPRVDLSIIGEKVRQLKIGEKFAVVGDIAAENSRNFVDTLKECKPGKMDRHQRRRFNDNVLPILIGGIAFVLCLTFIVGSLARSLGSEDRIDAALHESMAQAEAERAAAAEIEGILNTAAVQAAGYDYQAAINTLDSYKDAETGRELTDEMAAARATYTAAMTDLVVWEDPASIPNLSFHPLIVDTDRAYAAPAYANSYRTLHISTDQFSAILEKLHENGYVLVNLDSCIAESTDANGNTTYDIKPIFLPAGKTPIMITETLVNYFSYMTDGNGDGTPDAAGGGFAHRLVIDGGDVKAEYIDASGQTHVGDYDLVPILNSFIEAHPDFSYQGAKAILAVTGSEGIFGWRTNEDPSVIDRVKDIAEVLRANGYQIASNSFANLDYSGRTTEAQITADLNQWAAEITPILGDVDIMVIAKGSSIRTRGIGFQMMEEAGFHYIIDCTGTPSGELDKEYFHQHRMMVTGENLDSGLFDAYFTFGVGDIA